MTKMMLERIEISLADMCAADVGAAAKGLVLSFTEKGRTLASAESCTGGKFGDAVTSVSGASAVYLGGVISYTNDVKRDILGVSEDTLERFTAVSEYTALEMAHGVMTRLGSDFGVSVTGYAGPTGGDEINPVGTVFVGISTTESSKVVRISFPEGADRDSIRSYAVYFMLCELLRAV